MANEKAVRAGIEPASLNIGGARFGANVTTISAKNDTNENSPHDTATRRKLVDLGAVGDLIRVPGWLHTWINGRMAGGFPVVV